MKGKKIIIISIIINILTIGIIYNFIKKDYLNNEKIIVKAMTETEHENTIKSLNKSHDEFVHYIEGCKTKIASAITDMGVDTSNEDTLEAMSRNIRSIAKDASSIRYDNSSSNLTSTNVQGAVDELNDSLGGFEFKVIDGIKQVSTDGGDTWENFKSAVTYEQVGIVPAESTTATCTIDTSKSQFVIAFFLGWENRGAVSLVYFNANDKSLTGVMSSGVSFSLNGNKITFSTGNTQMSHYNRTIYAIY